MYTALAACKQPKNKCAFLIRNVRICVRSGLGSEGPGKGRQPGLLRMGLAGCQGRGVPCMEEGGVPELRSYPDPGQGGPRS